MIDHPNVNLYLAKFKWGLNFLTLNERLFDEYEQCANSTQLVQAQNNILLRIEQEDLERREIDIYPHFSSDEDKEELNELAENEASDELKEQFLNERIVINEHFNVNVNVNRHSNKTANRARIE